MSRKFFTGATFANSVTLSSANFIDLTVDQTDSAKARVGVSSGSTEAFLIADNTGAGHITGNTSVKLMGYDSSTLQQYGKFHSSGLDVRGDILAEGGGDITVRNTGTGNAYLRAYATGTGAAGLYIDAVNGDAAGSDYFSLRQLDNKSIEFNARTGTGVTVFYSKGSLNLTQDGANSTFEGDVTINGSHLKLLNHSGSYEGQSTDYLYIGGSGLDGSDAAIYLGNAGNNSGYGWRFFYQGSGSGNLNKLIFRSENLGSPVDALTFTQDGNATFGGDVSLSSGNELTVNNAANNNDGGIHIKNDNNLYSGALTFHTEYSGTDTHAARVQAGTNGTDAILYLQVANTSKVLTTAVSFDHLNNQTKATFTGDVDVANTLKVNQSYQTSNEYLLIGKNTANDGGIVMSSKSGSSTPTNDWQIINSGSARDLHFYAYGLGANALVLDRETGNATFAGNVTVGSDAAGKDVKFFGDLSGEYFMWDENVSTVNIYHRDELPGLEVYVNAAGQTTQPQLKVGRSNSQYWGAYVDDRNAHLVHRQDETSGTMTTRFDQWDSNTSDTNGHWAWRSGNGSGGSMSTALELTQAGNATFTGDITSGNIRINKATNPNLQLYRSDATTQLWELSIDSSGRLLFQEAASSGGTQYTRFQIDDTGEATFTGSLYIPDSIYHAGDTNSYFGFDDGNDTFRVVLGGGERLQINTTRSRFNGHIYVAADSTYDIGENATRFRDLYVDEIDGGNSKLLTSDASNYFRINTSGGSAQLGLFRTTSGTIGGGYIGIDVNKFRIYNDSFSEKFSVNISSGDVNTKGHIILPNSKYLEYSGTGRLINTEVSSWSNASEHNILYAGWTNSTGDYLSFKVPGNGTNNHGNLIIGDNGLWFGRMNATTSAVATDSNTNPHSGSGSNYFRVNTAGQLQVSGSVISPIYYDTAGTTNYLDLGNSSISLKVPGSLDVDGTGSNNFVGNIVISNAGPILQANSTNNASGFRINVTGLDDNNDDLLRIQDSGTTRVELHRDGTFQGLTTTSLATPTITSVSANQSLFLYANGSGHIYLGDSGNGANLYHYSAANDGKYTTYDFNGSYYRISTTATAGVWVADDLRVSTDLNIGGTFHPLSLKSKKYTSSNTSSSVTAGTSLDDEYMLLEFGENTSPLYLNIKTAAHNSASFVITRGYHGSNTASIHCTGSTYTANGGYPNLRGIRVIKSGTAYKVIIRLFRSGSHTSFELHARAWGGHETGDISFETTLTDTFTETVALGEIADLSQSSSLSAAYSRDTLWADSATARFGNASDLQIYHDGSNSYIEEAGDGDLFIKASNDIYLQGANNEFMAEFSENGSVDLYHNGSKKFETTSSGADVTGTLNLDNLTINGAQGSDGQVLTSTGSGIAWEDASGGSSGISQSDADVRYVRRTGGTSSAMSGDLHIISGGPKIYLQDNTDDDDQQIIFRNNSGSDEYKIATQDFTSGGGQDGFYIGSTTSDGEIGLVTANTTALTLDTSQNATFAGNVRLPNSGKLFLWNDHDSNFLRYNLWQASASAGMTIKNIASGGSLIFQTNSLTALTLDSSQNSIFAGHAILNSGKYLEFSNQGKLINMDVTSWSNASEHNLLYAGWASNIGDYLSFKVPGNGTNAHGNLIIGDNGLWFGRMNTTTSAQATDSSTNPHSGSGSNYFRVNTAGQLQVSGSVVSPIYYDTAGTTNYLDLGNSSISLKVPGNIDLSNNKAVRLADRHSKLSFVLPYFTHGTSNLAVDLILGNAQLNGILELKLTAGYSHQNATGEAYFKWIFGFNQDGSIWYTPCLVESNVTVQQASQIYVDDPAWDSTNARYFIRIYHKTSTGNQWEGTLENTSQNAAARLVDNFSVGSLLTSTSTSNTHHHGKFLSDSSGDVALKLKSKTGGDPTIILDSAVANRSGLIKYQDNGTNIGRIEYVHNGDKLRFQAGSATGQILELSNTAATIAGDMQADNIGLGAAAVSFGTGVPTLLFKGTNSTNGRAGALYFKENDGTDTAALYVTDGGDGYGTVLTAYQGSLKLATGSLTGTVLTLDQSNNATFEGNVTISNQLEISQDAASDRILFTRSGHDSFSLSLLGSQGLTITNVTDNRADLQFSGSGDATFAGDITASSGTGHFSVVNASGYQLNGTYVMDSSRNLVNINSYSGGSVTATGKSNMNRLLLENARISSHEEYPVGHYTGGKEIWSFDPSWTDDQLLEYFGCADGVEWLEDSTAPAGWAIKITGNKNVGGLYDSGFPYIPIEEDAIYYMECYIRGVDSTSNVTHYMGSQDFTESFSAPSSGSGNPGSFGYWVMSNTASNGTTWTKRHGIIRGHSDTQTGNFETGAKYWTPQALFNYTNSSGTRACVISGWKVIKISSAEYFADGSIATPSISFAEDKNTGLFRPASDQLGFSVGGSRKMYMTATKTFFQNQANGVEINNGISLFNGALSISGDTSNAVTFTESGNGLMTISAPDDIVLDCGSDIVLDAGGNDIRFQVNNVEYGKFKNDSGNFSIYSSIENEDILFKGNDGGTTITALTLDMSNGGSAVFRDDIDLGGKITGTGIGTNSLVGPLSVNNASNNSNAARLDVKLAQTNGTLAAANTVHFGDQAHSSGQIMGITLGYKEHANVSYRKLAMVAEGRGDNAARQNLHLLVNNVFDSSSASLAHRVLSIDGFTQETCLKSVLALSDGSYAKGYRKVHLGLFQGPPSVTTESRSFRLGRLYYNAHWGHYGTMKVQVRTKYPYNGYLEYDVVQASDGGYAVLTGLSGQDGFTRQAQVYLGQQTDTGVDYGGHDIYYKDIVLQLDTYIQARVTVDVYAQYFEFDKTSVTTSQYYFSTLFRDSSNQAQATLADQAQLTHNIFLPGHNSSSSANSTHVLRSASHLRLNTGKGLYFDGNTHSHTYIVEEGDNNMKFYVGGSEHMGVGGGDVFIRKPMQMDSFLYHIGNTGTSMQFDTNNIKFRTNNSIRVEIDSNGSTAFSNSINITGTVTASSDVVAFSDERLKTNVKTLDGSKVYDMRGVSFTKDDKKGSGVIAQELEKIAPELVNNESEFKSVAYGNITGYLIEAIKDLKQEIEDLKKQIK